MTLEKQRARVSAGEMAYADLGEGSPVLLLHGFPTSSHLWRDVAPLLAPRARAIVPDLIGYGDSSKPSDAALDIRAQAGYVRELLDQLGVGELAVVGHDIGGGVAQLLALEGGVAGMVLVDSICFDSWPIEGVRQLQGADPADVDREFAERVVGIAFDAGMGHRERLSEDDLAEYLRPWREDPMALVRAARAIDGVGLVGTEEALGGLGIRTFLVWGEDDPFQPWNLAKRLQDAVPEAAAAILPGCSHYVMEDAADTVGPMIVEFLRTTYLGGGHAPEGNGRAPVDLGVSFERPDQPPADPD